MKSTKEIKAELSKITGLPENSFSVRISHYRGRVKTANGRVVRDGSPVVKINVKSQNDAIVVSENQDSLKNAGYDVFVYGTVNEAGKYTYVSSVRFFDLC